MVPCSLLPALALSLVPVSLSSSRCFSTPILPHPALLSRFSLLSRFPVYFFLSVLPQPLCCPPPLASSPIRFLHPSSLPHPARLLFARSLLPPPRPFIPSRFLSPLLLTPAPPHAPSPPSDSITFMAPCSLLAPPLSLVPLPSFFQSFKLARRRPP
eukprot:995272-Pleurochrysis_carterae.AAC.1